jgi:hypothetical protein
MKVKTLIHLEDILDSELAWRKKEMSLVISNLTSAKEGSSKDHYLRVAFLLIYAHWEGYIKVASQAYLEYVISQRLTYDVLKSNFLATGLLNHLENAPSVKNIKHKKEIIDFILNDLNVTKFYGESAKMIDAESNLNIDVLEKICLSLGMEITILAADKIWIDTRLLKFRNRIAHGDKVCYNNLDFSIEELRDEIQKLLDTYRNMISNAAVMKAFLKK